LFKSAQVEERLKHGGNVPNSSVVADYPKWNCCQMGV
jgi:hypothetical protein